MNNQNKPLKIPNYIQDILERSEYAYDPPYTNNENYAAGYTILIQKKTRQTQANTFQKEIEKLKNWVQKTYEKHYKDNSKIFHELYVPQKTYYKYRQYAAVTIFDPMMKHLEPYILQRRT